MSLVEMTWSVKNRELVLARKKLATTRRTPHGFRGDHFLIDEQRFIFTAIRPMRLGHVAELYYQLEGAESPEAFLKEWTENYGLIRPPNLTDLVYLHEFSEVRAEPPA
jgi:hypothetical protein